MTKMRMLSNVGDWNPNFKTLRVSYVRMKHWIAKGFFFFPVEKSQAQTRAHAFGKSEVASRPRGLLTFALLNSKQNPT